MSLGKVTAVLTQVDQVRFFAGGASDFHLLTSDSHGQSGLKDDRPAKETEGCIWEMEVRLTSHSQRFTCFCLAGAKTKGHGLPYLAEKRLLFGDGL